MTVLRGLKTGAALATTITGTMMVASTLERGSPWAGVNAMATGIGVGGRRVTDRFAPAVTLTGLAVLTGGMLAWGVLYERALTAAGRQSSLATGALSGAAGYILDRFILSKWLMPNFRRTLGLGGLIAKYTALTLTSAASGRLSEGAPTASAA